MLSNRALILPPDRPGLGSASLYAASLRLTALRIDPRPALDAAAFTQMSRDLWQLKIARQRHGVSTERQPLDVHPALRRAETASGFRRAIADLVTRHAGQRNFDLSNVTLAARSARVVRAFGMQDDQAVLNQRTINESAAVAHWQNTRMPEIATGKQMVAQSANGERGEAPF